MSLLSIPVSETLAHGLSAFVLDCQLFGIPVRVVREVNAHLDITPVPRAPDFVRGLVNLRGHVVTVVDLGVRLGFGRRQIDSESRLVVLKTSRELANIDYKGLETSEEKIGLLVDRISEVVIPRAEDLQGPPSNLAADTRQFVAGVCKTDKQAITVLNAQQILNYEVDPTSSRETPRVDSGDPQ